MLHKNLVFGPFSKPCLLAPRKKKSGKEVTAFQCVPVFEKFLALVRLKILPSLTDLQEVDSLYGKFPPHLRLNMDQCPLPFVVGQDTTFGVACNNDVHMKCPGEASWRSIEEETIHNACCVQCMLCTMQGMVHVGLVGLIYFVKVLVKGSDKRRKSCGMQESVCTSKKMHG